jgi:hypothetical protein
LCSTDLVDSRKMLLPGDSSLFLICAPSFHPLTRLFSGLFTGMNKQAQPTSRHVTSRYDSARHGSMALDCCLNHCCRLLAMKSQVQGQRETRAAQREREIWKRGKAGRMMFAARGDLADKCCLLWRFNSTGISLRNPGDALTATHANVLVCYNTNPGRGSDSFSLLPRA